MLAQTSLSSRTAVKSESTDVVTDKNGGGHWDAYTALTIDDYESKVINDKDNLWVVAFVSPLCGACHGLADEWGLIKADKDIKDRPIKFGYVDISQEKNLEILSNHCGDLSVQFTPSVLLYGQ